MARGMAPRNEKVGFVANKAGTCNCQAWRCGKRSRRADDGSELTRSEELNAWMMAKLKESYYEARRDYDQRKSIVQKVIAEEHGVLRADRRAS